MIVIDGQKLIESLDRHIEKIQDSITDRRLARGLSDQEYSNMLAKKSGWVDTAKFIREMINDCLVTKD